MGSVRRFDIAQQVHYSCLYCLCVVFACKNLYLDCCLVGFCFDILMELIENGHMWFMSTGYRSEPHCEALHSLSTPLYFLEFARSLVLTSSLKALSGPCSFIARSD